MGIIGGAVVGTFTATESGNRVAVRLTNPVCRDYLIMLSVGSTLVLPARNLQFKN